MVALEISLGRDSSIDFDDYLNDPREPTQIGWTHAMTEVSPTCPSPHFSAPPQTERQQYNVTPAAAATPCVDQCLYRGSPLALFPPAPFSGVG